MRDKCVCAEKTKPKVQYSVNTVGGSNTGSASATADTGAGGWDICGDERAGSAGSIAIPGGQA